MEIEEPEECNGTKLVLGVFSENKYNKWLTRRKSKGVDIS